MQIKVKWRRNPDAGPRPNLNFEKAGILVQEGCLVVYPDVTKPDCTMYPLDLIEQIDVMGDLPGEEPGNVVPIRGKN